MIRFTNFSKNITMILFFAIFIIMFGWIFMKYRGVILSQKVFIESPRLVVGTHIFEIEIANTFATRMQGLSDRENLPENHGMYFLFSATGTYGFWMKGMKFPIDIVWILENKVIGFEENIPPLVIGTSTLSLKSYHPETSIDAALELNAGDAKRYGLKAGDTVRLIGTTLPN